MTATDSSRVPAAAERAAADRWALPALRPSTLATPADLAARRAALGALPPPEPVPGIAIENTAYAGVPCVVCAPPEPRDVLVYFHGGGYRLGSAAQFTPFAARLAGAARARVVVVDYRLAPEHPYPAALHDAAKVYGHLLAESGTPPVAVGDSAGGGLAASLVTACVRAGIAVPRGLVLLSAWLDLRCAAASYRSRSATDQLFSLEAARQAAEQYLQGHAADDPLASPLLADVATFPPSLLFASSDEVLLDDTMTMAAALAQARVPVATSVIPGVPHTWPSVAPHHPASAAALDVAARFVDRLPAPR
ncbi:alpha/beta hydrolase [Frankia sp. CNm7]|uniref:Alpha/beta hydrolase n=1 Tax=Frankia nepalensis TaxID=1836974 RepID=A0A937RAX8_9ACTN|nr:alpha/beta hydrolase [Frankia nepalensis]MBL7500148.1 alpha/beta hydrolase [Frankia nepalensis]MBL7512379.1 alpha/beta hydrolase [Frankia nepalensis]MBL7518077.1 alpha/beta hydrolase [Frankia nepalensis]MBL7625660.1 alpha/beta hydrolase [Frankia nepalensis]